jgi:hypothetical protein
LLKLRPPLEAAVVVVFALLIWSNFTLRRQHAHAAVAARGGRAFAVHDTLEPLPVIELSGARGTLRFDRRTLVAIVDPRCESCQQLIATMHADAGTEVLSVAPMEETKSMAQRAGLTPITHILGQPLPQRIATQLQIYPQLFVVEGNHVVRTCATMAECVTSTPSLPAPSPSAGR